MQAVASRSATLSSSAQHIFLSSLLFMDAESKSHSSSEFLDDSLLSSENMGASVAARASYNLIAEAASVTCPSVLLFYLFATLAL